MKGSLNMFTKAKKNIAVLLLLCIFLTNGFVICIAFACSDMEDTSVVKTDLITTSEEESFIDTQSLVYHDEKNMTSYIMPNGAEILEEETTEVEQPKVDTVIVEPGDSLWSIAAEYYGDGSLYPYLKETNNLESDTIYDGQVITVEYTEDAVKIEHVVSAYYSNIPDTETPKASNEVIDVEVSDKEDMTYYGDFFITGYDPWCAHCCGSTHGITASGKEAVVGRTVAASMKQFKMGTVLYIEGYGYYTIEDTGCGAGTIDVACFSHDECYAITKHNVSVYVVN